MAHVSQSLSSMSSRNVVEAHACCAYEIIYLHKHMQITCACYSPASSCQNAVQNPCLVVLQGMTARTADAVQQMSVQLSNKFSAMKLLTAAVDKGVKQMQITLEQQTVIMLQVMGSCEQIKAGQAEIMNAILSTKAQTDTILQTLKEKEMEEMYERLGLLRRSMQYHLRDPSEWMDSLCRVPAYSEHGDCLLVTTHVRECMKDNISL